MKQILEYITCAHCKRKKHSNRYPFAKGGHRFFICNSCYPVFKGNDVRLECLRKDLLDKKIFTEFQTVIEDTSRLNCVVCGKRKPAKKFDFFRETGYLNRTCKGCEQKIRLGEINEPKL